MLSRAAPCTWMKKTSTLSLEPGNLQPLPASAPCSIAGAIEIFDDAGVGAAAEGEIRVQPGRPVLIVDVDKVGGPRQQRNGEPGGADRRRFGLRLVEAGDKALSAVVRLDAHRHEVFFEECARLGRIGRRRSSRRFVSFGESSEIDAERAAPVGLHENMVGRTPERFEGGRRGRRPASREARRTTPVGRAGRAPRSNLGRRPISLRLRWRPASSSDRASGCRVRTSRRP